MTNDQFEELMRAVARIDTRMDAKFAALESRLTSIEQQVLQRLDDADDALKGLRQGIDREPRFG